MASRSRTALLALLLATSITLGVAGCSPERVPISSPPASTPDAAPSVTPTSVVDDPSIPGTPVTISCSQLVDDQTIYDWGSGNFALDPKYTAPKGSDAATVVGYQGLACGWVNLTSGEHPAVAVANLPTSELDRIRAKLTSTLSPTTEFGGEGWFGSRGSDGTTEVISGSYWIVTSSTYYGVAGDASQILAAAASGAGA